MAVLDDATKARVRYHLGYPSVENATILTAGVPSVGETQWLFERHMNHVFDQYAVDQIKSITQTMDTIEQNLANVSCLVKAIVVGDIQPNLDAGEYLEREYVRWGWRIADLLSICPNPYSPRYGAGGSGLNVPVMGNDA